MKYSIHLGKLCRIENGIPGSCLCYIKSPVYTVNKKILSFDGSRELMTEISRGSSEENSECRFYRLKDGDGHSVAEGRLMYVEDTDPWPVTPVPRTDRIELRLGDENLTLEMLNSQNFTVTNQSGNRVMELIHDGINGGWKVSADDVYDPMIVMGLFLFCRGLDKENEFVVV